VCSIRNSEKKWAISIMYHYSGTWWRNGFVIFKNITSYFKIRMAKSQTHEKIHPSYHRHKTFVLVLYTTRSFRAVYAVACWSSWRRPHTIMSFLRIWFRFHFFSSSQRIWQPYSYQRACMTKILILLWAYGSMYFYSENR